LAVVCGQRPTLPGAVRKHEVEQAPLFAGWLANEQLVGVFCEFEKADAFFKIGLVSTLVLFDGALAPVLLLAPFGGLAVEESGIDPTVELVEIHGVDPRLESIVFRLQVRDGVLMVTALILMARAQGGP
jgi:hypothetical protein